MGTLTGTVRAREFAPVASLGYVTRVTGNLKFSIDAGAMFHGTPHAYDLTATGLAATSPLFQQSLEREKQEIEDEVRKYKVYPVVQIGFAYAF